MRARSKPHSLATDFTFQRWMFTEIIFCRSRWDFHNHNEKQVYGNAVYEKCWHDGKCFISSLKKDKTDAKTLRIIPWWPVAVQVNLTGGRDFLAVPTLAWNNFTRLNRFCLDCFANEGSGDASHIVICVVSVIRTRITTAKPLLTNDLFKQRTVAVFAVGKDTTERSRAQPF